MKNGKIKNMLIVIKISPILLVVNTNGNIIIIDSLLYALKPNMSVPMIISKNPKYKK